MKIVVVSDSHGIRSRLDDVLAENQDADLFLHCGDICLDSYEYPQFVTVTGNNDYYDYPSELVLNVPHHRIIMFHSHLFGYFNRDKQMIKKAKEKGCDIICYGHTHIADYRNIHDMYILNPGSLQMSRDGKDPSYAIMYIDEQTGAIQVEFRFVA
ncbi:hypothetical protein A4S06_01745 [Erysipelotrichaceae bacterium MTC7]|nr:hypothetical protein A4S06_01745 [Erysipelotrichaceae bacterium MTC7]